MLGHSAKLKNGNKNTNYHNDDEQSDNNDDDDNIKSL